MQRIGHEYNVTIDGASLTHFIVSKALLLVKRAAILSAK